MYSGFKKSLTQILELERKLSEAEHNLEATITKAESSKAKFVAEIKNIREERASRERDFLDMIDQLMEKSTNREIEFKDEMANEREITESYSKQVEEQN